MSAPRPGALVLGVDFGGTKTALAVADATGRRLAGDVVTSAPGAGAAEVVRGALEVAGALVDGVRARWGGVPLVGAGVVSPGIVETDRVRLAPNVPGWEDLALAAAVADGLAARGLAPDAVVTATDAKAAALAEARWGALAGSRCGVFLNLGTGTSAAVVVGGTVLTGAHGAAGEIGYALLHPGQPGFAAGRAPLEERASGMALGVRASAAAGRRLDARAALADPSPAVAGVVADALGVLGQHLVNLCCAVDPDVVAVGGGLVGAADVVLPPLRAALEAAVPFPPAVVVAHHPHDAQLVGAVALAVDRLVSTGRTAPAGVC